MILCIDIGGTKTLLSLMSPKGRILQSSRFLTAFDQNHFLNILLQELRTHYDFSKVTAISVAMPGPVKNNAPLWFGNLPWENFDIVSELKQLSTAPVFVENDANLAGLAEAQKIKGLSVYLTLSTGIGGSVIENGKIEASRRIYEPGHDKYEWNGHLCEWEDFASAKAIVEDFGKLTTEIKDRADWQEIALRVATGLHSTISSIRPNTIILGGPLGLQLKQYLKYLKKDLSTSLSPGISLPKIISAKLGDKSVIYGCYLYAQTQLPNK